MAKNNQELLNQIHDNASEEYKANIPVATSLSGVEVYQALDQYPTAKNEFINTLTNKVVKTEFYSKVFTNPLQMLHRGMLEYGQSIEQLFVEMAEKKGYYQNFDKVDKTGVTEGQATEESSLIGRAVSKVKAMYVSKNFEYKYKASINNSQLRGAFLSANGLSNLVAQITNSLTSGAQMDEYVDMKTAMFDACAFTKKDMNTSTGLMSTDTALVEGVNMQHISALEMGIAFNSDPKELAELIRGLNGRLTFPSTGYNMGRVKTWSRPEDLVFITTPEVIAKLDVNVLAFAFNVSSAEMKTRVILVDELPKGAGMKVRVMNRNPVANETLTAGTCLGIVMDKDFIQSYDTVREGRTFENGDTLTTNLFQHKHGIMANCYFANAVVIMDHDVVQQGAGA